MNRIHKALCMLLWVVATTLPLKSHAIIPENGWWWNGNNGTGFNLEVQDNLLFIAFFGFDAQGQAVWYTAGGPMTSDRNFTATLYRVAGGACVGCGGGSFNPIAVGPLTMAFTSSQTATVTILGASTTVRRFNFWLNETAPDAMLGEWSSVIGESSFNVFEGERIGFREKRNSTSGPYVTGNRLGSSGVSNIAVSSYSNNRWNTLLDSSTTFYRYFEFFQTGFNRVEGQFWVYAKGGSPSGAGTFFQAFRTASHALLINGTGPGSSKSLADLYKADQAQEEKDRALASGDSSKLAPADIVERAAMLRDLLERERQGGPSEN